MKISWTDRVRNEELHRVKDDRNFLHADQNSSGRFEGKTVAPLEIRTTIPGVVQPVVWSLYQLGHTERILNWSQLHIFYIHYKSVTAIDLQQVKLRNNAFKFPFGLNQLACVFHH